MKSILKILSMALLLFAAGTTHAQKVKTIELEQTPGKFEQTSLKLSAGRPYVFEVSNNGVDHELGFVIAPKGKEDDQASHIQASYLSKTILDGESASSSEVTLEKGEYVYFCSLNPTPLYDLVVK